MLSSTSFDPSTKGVRNELGQWEVGGHSPASSLLELSLVAASQGFDGLPLDCMAALGGLGSG